MSRTTTILTAVVATLCCNIALAAGKPLKVYILAGQSNMQGSAHKRTFGAIGDDPKSAPLLKDIQDKNGDPIVCSNAWITYLTGGRDGEKILQSKVKVGYGFDGERIGPEYAFGVYMDKALDEPILIIKTAWGGKSLAVDFRPPSAGAYKPSAKEKERGKVPTKEKVGHYYREMIKFVRTTLKNAESIRKAVPNYDAKKGYELAGFIWFQGWNDMCNRHHIAQYTGNMIHFITDVRKELDAPKLPFIVGILGVYGTDPDSRKFDKGLPVTAFRKVQFAAVEQYDRKAPAKYRGGVIAVDSGPYYELKLSDIYWKRRMTGHLKRQVKQGKMTPDQLKKEFARYGFGDGELTAGEQKTWDRCASNAEYHYLGSGKTFVRFGKALAEAILKIEAPGSGASKPAAPVKKPAKPAKEDAEKFSYYLGYRNGGAIAANSRQRPADNDAFLRGVSVALGIEEPRTADKDNADYRKGAAFGARFADFGKRRFPYLEQRKAVEGLNAGLGNKEPAYTLEELKKASDVCSKFVKTPARASSPMLGKQAPKWDVGRWHQLPEGKTSLDISDFQGKVLYMYCFQSWCPGCHSKGFPTLQQVSGKYKDDDSVQFVVFQTVFEDRASKPVNTFENLKKIATKYSLTMPFAQSGSREDKSKLMRAYKTRGTPWTMIIDKKGVIRYGGFHITPADASKLIDKLKAEKLAPTSRSRPSNGK
ncbi:MAG: sialate O-acetylesterase [Phycisphaerae bacterium]|nr:sialate O-acetylesterase [Phycisphaerae bacterium]